MPPFELEIPSVKAYSACLYEGTLKELIHVFKYKGRLALACVFSDIMMEYIKENPEIMDADIITAVPLHKSRLKEREFNQSMVIANKINEKLGFPVKEILEKTVKTKYQNELTKSERMTNLKGAFKVRENTGINGKRMLLIDDVMTTGATLNECAAAMLSSGAKSVTCFTLSRGI
jgi:ComF family protein